MRSGGFMKTLLIGLLTLGSISSFASIEVNGPLDTRMLIKEVDENKNYYDALGEMYQKASKPNIGKLINIAWSGRCFKRSTPYTAIGATTLFRKLKNPNLGPIEGQKYEGNLVLWKSPVVPVDFGDDKDFKWVTDFIDRRDDLPFSRIILLSDSILLESLNNIKIRVSEEYLVTEHFISKKDTGSIAEGSPVARCYYFTPEYSH